MAKWSISIVEWLKANKGKTIVFLAIITTTVLVTLVKQGVLILNAHEVKQAIANFEATEEINELLLSVTIMDLLSKFMIGLTFVYSFLLGLHFIRFDLKNRLIKMGD
ncbi:hypothetical protein NYE71_32745 [Bacillus sp. FSL K6-0273]|uniref:hypothetical protein n=1 Tax=Bacillus TaxID=1386 RepID=UPI0030F7F199